MESVMINGSRDVCCAGGDGAAAAGTEDEEDETDVCLLSTHEFILLMYLCSCFLLLIYSSFTNKYAFFKSTRTKNTIKWTQVNRQNINHDNLQLVCVVDFSISFIWIDR